MILSRDEILKAHSNRQIVIDPFEESLVSINSVDIRLGSQMWKLKEHLVRDLYNPDDSIWKEVHPEKASSVRAIYGSDWGKTVEDDDLCFILEGGEFYLATTMEKVGTSPNSNIVSEMKAKSSFGRQGCTTSLCAGLGDIGYVNQWVMEMRTVKNGDLPIAIGTPVAQIVFHLATPTQACYDGASRYQHGDQVRFLPKPMSYIKL